jgi:crotonobetainyl-CoA:carnitine CoA-transferase CaiB-like acyl-CoA transferase|tara:strand:+ start:852 stop:1919 length:1068 start_codon:yes stop_codon:yes gene_type:complete
MLNLKVIEIASVLAGPAVGQFFTELGAEVIKIENATTNGDMTRKWKNPNEKHNKNVSAYFASVNFGKTHLFYDLNSTQGYSDTIDLIKDADIVVCNFKTGDAEKLKLDFETIKKVNSKVIYAAIYGFGKDDPRVAFDMVLQAETGYLSMNGFPDKPNAKMPVAFIDLLTAHQLKEGILVALLQREKVNKPQLVEVSLVESAIASLANQASNWLTSGFLPQPMGSLHPNIAPYGEVILTKDNVQLITALGTDKQFVSFCKLLNCALFAEPDFYTNQNRVKNRTKLIQKLNELSVLYTSDELIKECIKHKVPVSRINNLKQVFDTETAKQMVVEDVVDGEILRRVKTVTFKISLGLK